MLLGVHFLYNFRLHYALFFRLVNYRFRFLHFRHRRRFRFPRWQRGQLVHWKSRGHKHYSCPRSLGRNSPRQRRCRFPVKRRFGQFPLRPQIQKVHWLAWWAGPFKLRFRLLLFRSVFRNVKRPLKYLLNHYFRPHQLLAMNKKITLSIV